MNKSFSEKWSGVTVIAALICFIISFQIQNDYGWALCFISFPLILISIMTWCLSGQSMEWEEKANKLKELDETDIIESIEMIRVINGERFKYSVTGEDARKFGLLWNRFKISRYDWDKYKVTFKKEKI
jgi:hypothetical protein